MSDVPRKYDRTEDIRTVSHIFTSNTETSCTQSSSSVTYRDLVSHFDSGTYTEQLFGRVEHH